MDKPPRKFDKLVWAALVLTLAVITVTFVLAEIRKRQTRDVALRLSYPLPDFTLTNQLGQPISLGDLRGQVWIADIIFTRCAGPCPLMTQHLSELQKALPKDAPVKLVTLTTDPEFDTPAVLKSYGERYGAEPARWFFLTGTKPQIGALAVDGLKFTSREQQPELRENPNDLFIHSTIFAVVDKQGRLRGVFESTGEGVDWPSSRQRILAATKMLSREK